MGQPGQGQQALGGRFGAEAARGAVGKGRHLGLAQAVHQGKTQRVGHERRQHSDLSRRNRMLVNQLADLLRDPINHFGHVAVISKGEGWRLGGGGLDLPVVDAGAEPLGERLQGGCRDPGLREGHRGVAGLLQGGGAFGVGAQEYTVATVGIGDQQGRFELRQPLVQHVVDDRDVFFHVVKDQVGSDPAGSSAKLAARVGRDSSCSDSQQIVLRRTGEAVALLGLVYTASGGFLPRRSSGAGRWRSDRIPRRRPC